MQTESSSDWLSYIKQTLSSLGFANTCMDEPCIDTQRALQLNSNKDQGITQYVQTWNSELSSTGKLRFYKLFKTVFEREPYINLPPHLWVPITKLRISCHPLQIETGCYTIPSPNPSSEKFCWCCEGKVEDKLHFVFQCQLFDRNGIT